jgi:hypothetical protein
MRPLQQWALVLAVIATAGEWLTREDDGSRVCRLQSTIATGMAFSLLSWCTDWQIPKPFYGQAIPGDPHGWVRCQPGATSCQIHIENRGWVP